MNELVVWINGTCSYTKEALGLSFKLLEINPEAYTAWNYRKLAFQHNIGELSEPEAIKSAIDDELRVVSFELVINCIEHATMDQIVLCSSLEAMLSQETKLVIFVGIKTRSQRQE